VLLQRDLRGRIHRIVDSDGRATEYGYDLNGDLLRPEERGQERERPPQVDRRRERMPALCVGHQRERERRCGCERSGP